jgi:hypothetical protein
VTEEEERTTATQAVAVCLEVFFAPAFAASGFLRLATVCAPNFLVNRSTRPSVSISFCHR